MIMMPRVSEASPHRACTHTHMHPYTHALGAYMAQIVILDLLSTLQHLGLRLIKVWVLLHLCRTSPAPAPAAARGVGVNK